VSVAAIGIGLNLTETYTFGPYYYAEGRRRRAPSGTREHDPIPIRGERCEKRLIEVRAESGKSIAVV
jgi:hypothetical protein